MSKRKQITQTKQNNEEQYKTILISKKNKIANKLNTKNHTHTHTQGQRQKYTNYHISAGLKQFDIRLCLQFIIDTIVRDSSKIPAGLSTPNISTLRALRDEKSVGWNLINLALLMSLRLCFTMSFLPELPLKTLKFKEAIPSSSSLRNSILITLIR